MTEPPLAAKIALSLLCAALVAACSGPAPPAPAVPAPDEATPSPSDGDPEGVVIVDGAPAEPPPVDPPPPPTVEERIEAIPAAAPDAEAGPRAAKADPGASLCTRYRALRNQPPAYTDTPIPCERLDALVYYVRSSAGACGPTSVLRVSATGDLELERTGPSFDASGSRCAEPKRLRHDIEASRAREILAAACAELNRAAPSAGIGCKEGTRRLHFMAGDEKMHDTRALPCGEGPMAATEARMTELLSIFR